MGDGVDFILLLWGNGDAMLLGAVGVLALFFVLLLYGPVSVL